ncbi:MAG: DNA repair protein RadA [Candidatus Latescibacteria bacterium]|nr:DNA repair protein RadA [Candidatus Latescibacterota bacterium]
MAKQKPVYICQSCGANAPRWFGRCSSCGEWNTCVEETVSLKTERRESSRIRRKPVPITEVEGEAEQRWTTGISEMDRVLGGGIVIGSLVLVGGDPGIGKSTLLLQVSGELAAREHRVLYVSAEESLSQTKMRARRIGALIEEVYVTMETDLDRVIEESESLHPDVVVIDSIQTMYRPDVESAPGSVSQVRECAARLMRVAKETGFSVFIIGHVTKEGTIAGPRVLEHLVDTVLYLEGERHGPFRILRAAKNRFGSVNEIGIFEMRGSGMIEVMNPSQILLSERSGTESGAVVTCSFEGSRPLLVEIQALVARTGYGYPQRTTTGIDGRRLAILIAVLEKRVGISLADQDIFVNIAGGIRLDEPAVDLGVALAVISSFREQPIDPKTVAIGEVGLGGEVRTVPQVDRRIAEAQKLGFTKVLLPKGNIKGLKRIEGVELVGIADIEVAHRVGIA